MRTRSAAEAPAAPPQIPLDDIPGGALLFDLDSRVMAWGKRCAEMFDGLGIELIQGETAQSLHLRISNTIGVPVQEFRPSPPAEEILSWRRSWIRSQTRLPSGQLLVQWVDIAAPANRRREKRAERLRALLDRLTIAVGALGSDDTWLVINRALASQPGGPGPGSDLASIGCPDLIQAVTIYRGGETVAGRRIKWGPSWFSLHIEPGDIEGEEVIWCWLTDTTNEVLAEARAEQALRTTAELLDAATDATMDLDLLSGKARVNRRLVLLLGLPHADASADGWYTLPALTVLEACGEESASALFDLADRAADADEELEWRGPLGLGERRRQVAVRARRFGSGAQRRALLLVSDVDVLHRQTEALQHLVKEAQAAAEAKERFLATMSHELRTPFAGVVAALEAILAGLDPMDQRNHSYAARALEAAQALIGLLDDLLDLQRIEEGRLRLEPCVMEPRAIARQVLSLLEPRVAAGVTVELSGGEADARVPDWIVADPTRVRQILFNLVGNAVKFTVAGRIRIQMARRAARHWSILVEDDGPGMPEKVLGRIRQGERFVQADQSASRRQGGSGLGLSIVRGLADLQGGSMQVDSTPGQGTRVEVVLPLVPAEEPTAEASVSPLPDLSHLSVLLVEDDQLLRMTVPVLLQRLGIMPQIAEDGKRALTLLARRSFDVVLTDLHMPEVSGWDVAKAALALPRPPRVIAFTADGFARRSGAGDDGIERILIKPVRISDLAAALGNTAARASGPTDDPQHRHDAEQDGSAVPVFDPRILLEGFGDDVETALEIGREMVPHLGNLLQQAEAGVDLRRTLHTIKGGSRTGGALALAEAATAAEQDLKLGDGADLAPVRRAYDELAGLIGNPAVLLRLLKEQVSATTERTHDPKSA